MDVKSMSSVSKRRVAVIGAGVIGLSTAVCIQKTLPDASVTVIADRFNKETLSDGAPAMFIPSLSAIPNLQPDLYRRIMKGSSEWFQERCYAEDAAESGIFLSSGYRVDEDPDLSYPSYGEFMPNCRALTSHELQQIPGGFKSGYFCTTYMIENKRYLPYLMKRFKENGGFVVKKKIESFDQLADYDVVVPCAGLGSRELLNDQEMQPMRGQAIRVSAPWLKHHYITGGNKHIVIMPCYDSLFIGATTQLGDADMTPRDKDRWDIWDYAVQLIPGLKGCKIESDWVGLRPWRTSGIRIEQGIEQSSKGPIKVVYNYGHGRNGVGLSWGSAKIAAELVEKTLSGTTSRL